MPRPPKRHAESPPSGEKFGKARSTHEDESNILKTGPVATSTYQRWNKKGLGLIKKLEDIPEGWDWKDDDIHEDDLEANIKRCKERIEDGIMPQWWEQKLKDYEKDQAEVQELIASEPEGLAYDEIMRLKTLEVIRKAVLKNGDDYDQMRNVTTMMEKYRARELVWTPGRVTYWANGVQLTDYEEFGWERFRDLSDKHFDRTKSEEDLGPEKGYGGIWVEGVSDRS
ncbi:hypothetical protein N7450_006335 [Penicillium hetheringtonii]|uniref:Uncharacterized protein n=1 Tax=Penicillium hetheringtonii TaxID=911720 RepID=A0AAD6DK90_9EURO|nr:hypothetical protein N7450_006335 [Penicillium hetheringtonii]